MLVMLFGEILRESFKIEDEKYRTTRLITVSRRRSP